MAKTRLEGKEVPDFNYRLRGRTAMESWSVRGYEKLHSHLVAIAYFYLYSKTHQLKLGLLVSNTTITIFIQIYRQILRALYCDQESPQVIIPVSALGSVGLVYLLV
ncbi:hypothetical protein F4824DRAFT_460941 [Ustulina deusta]|nr:hypothetical protein F4824DRAFT_460941 [Ustulina deusta]